MPMSMSKLKLKLEFESLKSVNVNANVNVKVETQTQNFSFGFFPKIFCYGLTGTLLRRSQNCIAKNLSENLTEYQTQCQCL